MQLVINNLCFTVHNIQNPQGSRVFLPFCFQWHHGSEEDGRYPGGRHEAHFKRTHKGWLPGKLLQTLQIVFHKKNIYHISDFFFFFCFSVQSYISFTREWRVLHQESKSQRQSARSGLCHPCRYIKYSKRWAFGKDQKHKKGSHRTEWVKTLK